jgi:tripartite-type tricarboxylate transporter receptor subunit TctC
MRVAGFVAACLAGAVVASGLPSVAIAQSYPAKSVRIVIAFPAGGSIDTLGRILAQKLSEQWGQSVVIENRPGAGGNLGAAAAAQAAPDGYTLHFGAQTLAVNVTLSPTTAFDPVTSFDPIMLVATSQEVFQVSTVTPYKSVQDVIDYAKANPGKLNYYSVGIGSTSHLSTVLFMDVTGTKMQHVPYSQMAQGITDVLTGRTEINFGPMGSSIGNIREGKMRALALTGPVRSTLLPDVPTLTELGIKMGEESSWYALLAPKGTPRPIIDKINRDLEKVLALPDIKDRGVQLGYRFAGGPPEKLAAHLKSEIAKWDALEKKGAFK